MSPKGRPEGESAPERVSAEGNPVNPKGRPEGESAPKRDSAEGSPVSPRARGRRFPTMAERIPLSLVVITRDAASDIAACIASASFAVEAVVVDSGSGDDTVDVARAAGARVVRREFTGFGTQKNYAVGEAGHDWVLCLDADERVSPELADAIRAVGVNPGDGARALGEMQQLGARAIRYEDLAS